MKIHLILTAFLLFQSSVEAIIHIPRFVKGKAEILESGAGVWGSSESYMIDKTGKRLAPTKKEITNQSVVGEAKPEGYEVILVNRRHGLKNRATGEVVMKPNWYKLRYEGKHCVVAKKVVVNGRAKGEFGVIDLKGNVVVELVWDDVRTLTADKLWMVKRKGKYGLVAHGKVLVEPEWEMVGNLWRKFAENGLLEVKKGGKWGYIDRRGQTAIAFQFERAGSFASADRAIVSVGGDYYLIDQTGKKMVKLPGAPWDELNEMLLEVGPYIPLAKEGKWGCSDMKGKLVIPFEYEQISGPSHWSIFSEGLAPVVKDGKWGFVDQRGKLVIPCKWDIVGSFSEGLAYVERKGHWGFIDKAGKTMIGPVKIKEKEKEE